MENKFLSTPVGEGAVVFENVSSKTTNAGEDYTYIKLI